MAADKHSKAPILAGFLAGALAGAGLALLLGNPSAAEARPSELAPGPNPASAPVTDLERSTVADASVRSANETPATPEPTRPERERVGAPGSSEDLRPPLRAYAAAEIRRGWGEVRADAVPDDVLARARERAVETMLATPSALGREAAKAQDERERAMAAFSGGDGVELLANIDGSEPEAAEFVRSKEFANLFQPRGGGVSLAGRQYERGAELPSGAVLAFPAGVFDLVDLSNGNEPFPSDVTVRGAGMDVTLLYVDSQRTRSPLRRFAIEDCTVYCDNAITDIRSSPAVLSLRRVRVIGFDCGAGGSVAFYLSKGVALQATDCRFEGGYGRAPQSYANLMRSNGPCLARFERCHFERMSLDDAKAPTVLFSSCTMHELLDKAPRGPEYANCRITICDPEKKWDGSYRSKDLNQLFPHLGGNLQRR